MEIIGKPDYMCHMQMELAEDSDLLLGNEKMKDALKLGENYKGSISIVFPVFIIKLFMRLILD